MPWDASNYPPAMSHLPPQIRLKAIAIANAVLAREGDDAKAIRIGIAQAKAWGARRERAPHEWRRAWPGLR